MFAATTLPYSQTNAFSKIVVDYAEGAAALRPFYAEPPSLEGIGRLMEGRKSFHTNRKVLADALTQQYAAVNMSEPVRRNIEALLRPNTFTVCTAHQPNLFTGPLYFIYKILHAVKLADFLSKKFPDNRFVPVYYMGSEDADFAELNHTYVDGKKLQWNKEQGGAVGRMGVDKTLVQLIDELQGQLGVEEKGREVIALLRNAYSQGKTIQEATFELINELYGAYGLVVLIPDNPLLKAQVKRIFADDLFEHKPAGIVQKTSSRLEENYHAQAHPRDINLFYLKDNIRERIEKEDERFVVLNTGLSFTEAEMRRELDEHPERFSPNVILRGIYQETVLPNIAFVGGGGELAYWLQLKDLFAEYAVPFPALVLRNSFLVVEEKWKAKMQRLGLLDEDLFQSEDNIINHLVAVAAENPISLNGNLESAEALYARIKTQAETVDASLQKHAAAIGAKALKALQVLEKKMLRAEKRKHTELQQQVQNMKRALFPNGGLQERVENFSLFYAKWGKDFIDALYRHSTALDQQFTVLHQGTEP